MATQVKNIRDMGAELTVARTNTEMLVSCLGLSAKTKEIGLYTVLLTLKEPVTGLSLDNLQSGNYGINPVKASNGTNVAPTILDEEDPNAEFSFSMKEDLNFVRENAPFGVNRSILNAILKGESFAVGDDIVTVVGTNGTMKSTKARATNKEINLPFKALFGLEADKIKVTGAVDPNTGEVQLRNNTFRDAYNLFKKTICVELLTANGGKQYVDIIATCSIDSMVKDEGDVNSYNVSGMRICDVWQRNEYLSEVGESVKLADANKVLKELVVDVIVDKTGSYTATGDELVAKIGNDGALTISGAGSKANPVGTLVKNSRISARKFCQTGSTLVEQNCFAVVDTVGTGLTGAKCVSFGLGTTGSKNHICKVYSYERNEEEMLPYVTYDIVD